MPEHQINSPSKAAQRQPAVATKRAILYARVSGDDRRGATSSIEAQLADCQRYCEQRGYAIVDQAIEEPNKATSGADWLPELERIISLAPVGSFDVLVCREVDRLARNRFKQMVIEIELERHGVAVEYAVGQFEDTDEGRLQKGIVSEFAEYERAKIRRRMINGIVRSVEAGNVTVGATEAPFGYRLVSETDGATGKPRRTLVINEAEATIVRELFARYAAGASLHELCNWLDAHYIPPPGKGLNARKRRTDAHRWSVSTLGRLLKARVYIGEWAYRKTKTRKSPTTGKAITVARPREEWITLRVPSLVTLDTFEAVQERKARNKRELGRRHLRTYTLGGMLQCARCGAAVIGLAKKSGEGEIRYYLCGAAHNPKQYGAGRCKTPRLRAERLEPVVWAWVKGLLLEPETLRRQLNEYQERQRERVRPQLAMLESSQARLGEIEGRKERLIAAYTAGVLTLDDLAKQKNVLDKEMADLNRAIAILRAEAEPHLLSEEQIAGIEELATRYRAGAGVADDDPALQREIFRQLRLCVTLGCDDDQRWADVSCILESERLPMDSHTVLSVEIGRIRRAPAP